MGFEKFTGFKTFPFSKFGNIQGSNFRSTKVPREVSVNALGTFHRKMDQFSSLIYFQTKIRESLETQKYKYMKNRSSFLVQKEIISRNKGCLFRFEKK